MSPVPQYLEYPRDRLRDATWSRIMRRMEPATWTILVATLGERRSSFERMMAALLPQTDSWNGQVQVMAYWNNGDPPLPQIRQLMVEAATGEYVSWVDDDDLVPDYFVHEAMVALASRPDYVAWQVQCYSDGVPTGISYHSLKYGRWWNETGRYFRDISHINPIRHRLAMLADFRETPPGGAEDRAWVEQLRRSGQVRTEVLIDKIMYHYLFSTSKTAGIGSRWKRPTLIQREGFTPSPIKHPYFSYLPEFVNG